MEEKKEESSSPCILRGSIEKESFVTELDQLERWYSNDD
jgi:hypothetical protein